mmetsp:Transcript_11258/g.39214  ORF Transcript_11258/g.39214 Transcript_11258/m.39214 type:complete len:111 (+) Transcript_11258:197-529(+)
MATNTRDNLPANVARRVKSEMDRAVKEEYLRQQRNIAHTAKWAESQSKKAGKSATVIELERKEMEEELRTTAEQLVLVRRERLRVLYDTEAKEWEEELSKRGLALVVDDS